MHHSLLWLHASDQFPSPRPPGRFLHDLLYLLTPFSIFYFHVPRYGSQDWQLRRAHGEWLTKQRTTFYSDTISQESSSRRQRPGGFTFGNEAREAPPLLQVRNHPVRVAPKGLLSGGLRRHRDSIHALVFNSHVPYSDLLEFRITYRLTIGFVTCSRRGIQVSLTLNLDIFQNSSLHT